MSAIEELKELNKQLEVLLNDPHPGLFTWMERLSEITYEIGMYCGRDIIMKNGDI